MSTVKANTLLHSDGSTTNPPAIPALDQRMAKAWVNFNGTSTVAIRSSYNVSSITDGGTGSYTLNFSTAMSNADYSFFVTGENDDFTGHRQVFSTGSFGIINRTSAGATQDNAWISAIIFGT